MLFIMLSLTRLKTSKLHELFKGVYKCNQNHERFKSFTKWYKEYWGPRINNPPYKHVTQIGDPVLRNVAKEVSKDKINSDEVQQVIETMKYVMNKYKSMGLAAPQIGVSLRIFAMNFDKGLLDSYAPEIIKSRDMMIVPFQVVINPEMKIINYDKVSYQEACESVRGFCADVPRYKEIALSGFDQNGKPINMKAYGWTARIIQHEIDHLNGKFYTDIMHKTSLQCSCWEAVNKHSGRIEIRFIP